MSKIRDIALATTLVLPAGCDNRTAVEVRSDNAAQQLVDTSRSLLGDLYKLIMNSGDPKDIAKVEALKRSITEDLAKPSADPIQVLTRVAHRTITPEAGQEWEYQHGVVALVETLARKPDLKVPFLAALASADKTNEPETGNSQSGEPRPQIDMPSLSSLANIIEAGLAEQLKRRGK